VNHRVLVGAGLALFLCGYPSQAQNSDAVRSLSLDFKRVYSEGARVDSIAGRIYYSFEGFLFIKTTSPVTQYMRVEDNSMLLYYPDSREAFRIQQSGPVVIPFVQSLLWVVNRKLNLEKAGFEFVRTDDAGDTSTEYWKAPRKLSRQLGEIRIVMTGRKRVERIVTYGSDGRELVSTFCGAYCDTSGFLIPLRMTTWTSKDSLRVVEQMMFNRPLINRPDDSSNVFFSIPPDIRIKKVKL
jgi:hypothetical protein